MIVPFGSMNGLPGLHSCTMNKSRFCPIFLWSLFSISSCNFSKSVSSFVLGNEMPYILVNCLFFDSPFQNAAATFVSLNALMYPVLGTCGPSHKSIKSPDLYAVSLSPFFLYSSAISILYGLSPSNFLMSASVHSFLSNG
ncbi:Uncharacterised protein [uncultured archaeon]|nr:Uncharacterised protein [uncultured archaeon]